MKKDKIKEIKEFLKDFIFMFLFTLIGSIFFISILFIINLFFKSGEILIWIVMLALSILIAIYFMYIFRRINFIFL